MLTRRERLGRARGSTDVLARTVFTLAFAVAAVSACDKFGKEPRRSESGGEIDDSFDPAKIKSVKGVPVAEVKSAIAKRLGEPRPHLLRSRGDGGARDMSPPGPQPVLPSPPANGDR